MLLLAHDFARCCAQAYSADGTHLAVGGAGIVGQGNLLLWHRPSDEKRMISLRGGPVQAVAFSPDARRLAAASGQTIRLIEVATGDEQARFSRHTRQVRCLAFSPGGRFLLSGSEGRSLRYPGGEANLWDLQRWHRGWPRLRTKLDEYRGFCSVAFLGRRRVLLGSKNGEIFLWDRNAKEYWAEFNQRAAVRSVALLPRRGLLATAAGRVVHLWSLKTGRHRKTLRRHRHFVRSVGFAPDGKTLFSGSWDGTVRLWDVASKRQRACFDWGIGRIEAVAVAPDGMTAAAAGQGAVVWDLDGV